MTLLQIEFDGALRDAAGNRLGAITWPPPDASQAQSVAESVLSAVADGPLVLVVPTLAPDDGLSAMASAIAQPGKSVSAVIGRAAAVSTDAPADGSARLLVVQSRTHSATATSHAGGDLAPIVLDLDTPLRDQRTAVRNAFLHHAKFNLSAPGVRATDAQIDQWLDQAVASDAQHLVWQVGAQSYSVARSTLQPRLKAVGEAVVASLKPHLPERGTLLLDPALIRRFGLGKVVPLAPEMSPWKLDTQKVLDWVRSHAQAGQLLVAERSLAQPRLIPVKGKAQASVDGTSPASRKKIAVGMAAVVLVGGMVLGGLHLARQGPATVTKTEPDPLPAPAPVPTPSALPKLIDDLKLKINFRDPAGFTADLCGRLVEKLEAIGPDGAGDELVNESLAFVAGQRPERVFVAYLNSVLETPEQRAARLEREQREAAEAQRRQRIAELLATAKANDSKENGQTALAALDELLKLDPTHTEAAALRTKIAAYDGPIWLAQPRKLRTLEGHTSLVNAATFSPDGRRVVTGSADNTARLWDAQTGQGLRTLEGHTDWVRAATFSPDGRRVVTGSDDKTARLWDAQTGQGLRTLEGHTSGVTAATFSPDGRRVVTGSWDKTARLWDAQTGAEMARMDAGQAVSDVAFSPDGRQVVMGVGTYDTDPAKRRGEGQIWQVAE